MILELDCGNSSIKWRLVSGTEAQGASPVRRCGNVSELVERVSSEPKVDRCRIVSVRSTLENSEIVSSISKVLGVPVSIAVTTSELAGVTNGYDEPDRLGVDRWLGIVGAYRLGPRASVVFDLGTAITVDYITGGGRHLGGFITPGLRLLRQQLTEQTSGVRPGAADLRHTGEVPGVNTAQAVDRGCQLMIRAFVREQLTQAAELLGDDFSAIATGGDASLVADLPRIHCIPDLVFRGLALACP